MWILFWRKKWASKNTGSVITGVVIGLLVSFVLRRISYSSPCSDPQISVAQFNSQSLERLVPTSPTPDQDASANTVIDVPSPYPEKAGTVRKELLLVGVMTAGKYLKTRARSTYRTWGQDVPGKIIYFTGSNSSMINKNTKPDNDITVPLVMLPGVDDSYPPQKKSFMMLKYMFEHYGDKYEWFLRADDDVYIRMDLLTKLLRSISSIKMHYIGQAGLGTDFERGKLHLGPHENFCMGGPGVIFSRATLEKLVPKVNSCLENVRSNHEDVELGRCVSKTAGLSCTWSYEMRNLFHHSTEERWQLLRSHKYRNTISLHPLKNHASLYQIHSHFLGLKVQELFYESVKTDRDLHFIGSYSDAVNNTGLGPSLIKFSPPETSGILDWDFLNDAKSLFTHRSANPRSGQGAAARENLRNAAHELMDIVNNVSKVRSRVGEMKNLLYGYHRVNPLHGEDYVLDLLMTYRNYNPGVEMAKPVRRHAYIQKPFGPLQLRAEKYSLQQFQKAGLTTNVVMILPLSGRIPAFERFLQNFQEMRATMPGRINLKLIVVHFPKSETEEASVLNLVGALQRKTNNAQNVKVIAMEGEFSRGLALDLGISKCANDDLIFVIDVEFVFSPQVIRRVVLNTVRGERVYFPIIFSQYDPRFRDNKTTTKVSNSNGYWREHGYGIAAFFKTDYDNVGGYDLGIRGWGKEDVLLFDRFVNSNLTVFRAPDPELIHIYHRMTCAAKLSRIQREMCFGSQAATLGSSTSLMKHMFDNRDKSKILGVIASLVLNNSSIIN